MTWEEIKKLGSDHYKTGTVEPIDLYRSSGMLRHFALASIIKYAFRNSNSNGPISPKDMEKIKHYSDILGFLAEEEMVPDEVDAGDWIFKH